MQDFERVLDLNNRIEQVKEGLNNLTFSIGFQIALNTCEM